MADWWGFALPEFFSNYYFITSQQNNYQSDGMLHFSNVSLLNMESCNPKIA